MRKAASVLGLVALVVVLSSLGLHSQARQTQALDEGGAPVFKVDAFWPKWLPNKWSMQQVTGIGIDPSNDHVWFLNRAAAANPDETGGANGRLDCCIQGPELIELDAEGNVVHAWGEKGKTDCSWPTLHSRSGTALTEHYADVLRALGKQPGILGDIREPRGQGGLPLASQRPTPHLGGCDAPAPQFVTDYLAL